MEGERKKEEETPQERPEAPTPGRRAPGTIDPYSLPEDDLTATIASFRTATGYGSPESLSTDEGYNF